MTQEERDIETFSNTSSGGIASLGGGLRLSQADITGRVCKHWAKVAADCRGLPALTIRMCVEAHQEQGAPIPETLRIEAERNGIL